MTFNEVGFTLYPLVHFLDSDHSFCKDPHKPRETPPVKKTSVIVDTSGLQEHSPSTDPKANYSPAIDDDVFLAEGEQEPTVTEGLSGYTSGTDFSVRSGATSGDQARSTLEDALALPAKGGRIALVGVSESDGVESTTAGETKESGTHQLSRSSRALVNHCLQHATAYSLPKDHLTISLNSEQMQTILRVVADESARASYAMMEDIVKRASRLTLGQGLEDQRNLHSNSSVGGSVYPCSEGETLPGDCTGREGSVTSGALRSHNDSNSIGYSFERNPPSVIAIAKPPGGEKRLQEDPKSAEPQTQTESPEAQTLASLKAEALKDQQSKGRKSKVPKKPQTTRRRVTRACKRTKEENFEGMALTRTLVSGPLDPQWNPYKFYCQICKGTSRFTGKVPEKSFATRPLRDT